MIRARGAIGRTGRAMLLAATGALLLVGSVRAASPAPNVLVLPTTGVVNQVMALYIADGISRAEADGDAAVIIELDTPGGDLFSTNTSWVRSCRPRSRSSSGWRPPVASPRAPARSSRWPATSP